MTINRKIYEKRREIGLTQEQMANALGVTAPAVNKWEKGVTCPDIALLPALARLLKTDPNTLLCFEQSLTRQEIACFLNEATEKIRKEGYAQGFAWTLEKTREYPNCAELLHSAAMLLDGALLMANGLQPEKEQYDMQITRLYEQAAGGDDPAVANRAGYMLASRMLRNENYGEVQALLDRLPEQQQTDKRILQASLWAKQGRPKEAAALLERKVLQNVLENLMMLAQLVSYETAAGDNETAARLAAAAQKECEAFGLWRYSAYLAPMQMAVACKDCKAALTILSKMLEEILIPWDAKKSPLCASFSHEKSTEELGRSMLAPLLDELEHSADYDFLREDPEFTKLLNKYRAECTAPQA